MKHIYIYNKNSKIATPMEHIYVLVYQKEIKQNIMNIPAIFPKLKILVLDNLGLNSLEKIQFNTQTEITCLILRNNKIQDFLTFPQLPMLKHLDISNNPFIMQIENSLSNLYPKLSILIMGNTKGHDMIPEESNRISFSTTYLNSMEIFKVFFMTSYFNFDDIILKHEVVDKTILCTLGNLNLQVTLKLDQLHFIGTLEEQLFHVQTQYKTNTEKIQQSINSSLIMRDAKSQLQNSTNGPSDRKQSNNNNMLNMHNFSYEASTNKQMTSGAQHQQTISQKLKKQYTVIITIYNVVTGFEISLEKEIFVNFVDLTRGYKLNLNFDSRLPLYEFEQIINQQNINNSQPDFTNLQAEQLQLTKQSESCDIQSFYSKQLQQGQNVKIIFIRLGNTVLMICAERNQIRKFNQFSSKIQNEIALKSEYIDHHKAVVDQVVEELQRHRSEVAFYEDSKAPERFYIRYSPNDPIDDLQSILEKTTDKEARGISLSPDERYIQRLAIPAEIGTASRRSPGPCSAEHSQSNTFETFNGSSRTTRGSKYYDTQINKSNYSTLYL